MNPQDEFTKSDAMMKLPFAAKINDVMSRRAARLKLDEFAARVRSGPFSIVWKREPGVLRKQRTVRYERLNAGDLKIIERTLKQAYPALNRKERRHLARRHRFLFDEGLAI
jgi:hypothetical protein